MSWWRPTVFILHTMYLYMHIHLDRVVQKVAQLSVEHILNGFYTNFIQLTSLNSNKFLLGFEICVSINRPYLVDNIVSDTEYFDKDSDH